MDEKGLRLDFFIAIGALVISALTAVTLAYQTRVIGNEFAAAVWPYLNINVTYDTNGETFQIENDGLGPALIRSAQLWVDGRKVPGWAQYISALGADPKLHPFFRKGTHMTMSSVDAAMTVRAGDVKTVFLLRFPTTPPMPSVLAHALGLDLCYCSLNGSCFTLHATSNATPRTTHVSNCTASTAISAAFRGFPKRPRSRKD
jgi:hypothetical protein